MRLVNTATVLLPVYLMYLKIDHFPIFVGIVGLNEWIWLRIIWASITSQQKRFTSFFGFTRCLWFFVIATTPKEEIYFRIGDKCLSFFNSVSYHFIQIFMHYLWDGKGFQIKFIRKISICISHCSLAIDASLYISLFPFLI